MRSHVVLLVALLFVPTISATDWQETTEALGVTVVRVDDTFVHVSWTAAPGAVTYQLFRGPTLDDLELVTQTPNLAYTDGDAPREDTWYVVFSHMPPTTTGFELGPMSGKCLAMRGLTGFSITVAHCMPLRW